MMATVEGRLTERDVPRTAHDLDALFRAEVDRVYRTLFAFTGGRADVAQEGATFLVSSVGPYEPATDDGYDFTVPCDEPDGGWAATDPSRASFEDRIAATRDAESEPDHTASWISYLTPPTDDTEDPGPYVLVLGFTGNLDRHRDEAAELWGGRSACSSRVGRSRTSARSSAGSRTWRPRSAPR